MFLALMLSVLSAFILLLVETVRGYVSENEAVYAVDNAVRSCFAEYNRELFRRFHILLIDSSYKGYDGGSDETADHFRTYLENSITKSGICYTDLTETKSASDTFGYLYSSAVRYAKENLATDERLDVTGDDARFLTYILSVCGNDDIKCLDACRTGETEYLLYGSKQDGENIMWAREDFRESGEDAYEDFLCKKLEETDINVLTERFADLITEYMRENGSPGFDLEECYYAITFKAELKSPPGRQYSIEREYAYVDEDS